jgi:hypothetical protein
VFLGYPLRIAGSQDASFPRFQHRQHDLKREGKGENDKGKNEKGEKVKY